MTEQRTAATTPFDGSRDHRDIRTFYTSELDYLVAMRKRYACANCGTATGECSSCQRTRERIEGVVEVTAATTTEWDEWLSLFANRNEVAEEYASWLRAYGADWQQASKFNEAILRRWSPAGLRYIKERAWKIATQNL